MAQADRDLELSEVRRRAKERMDGICRVCRVCDGRVCAGEVPGMGGIGSDRLAVKDGRVTLHLRPVETLIWLARHDISTMSPSDGPSVSWSAP